MFKGIILLGKLVKKLIKLILKLFRKLMEGLAIRSMVYRNSRKEMLRVTTRHVRCFLRCQASKYTVSIIRSETQSEKRGVTLVVRREYKARLD